MQQSTLLQLALLTVVILCGSNLWFLVLSSVSAALAQSQLPILPNTTADQQVDYPHKEKVGTFLYNMINRATKDTSQIGGLSPHEAEVLPRLHLIATAIDVQGLSGNGTCMRAVNKVLCKIQP